MTRFARAKGSKSSNEKAPEESTPWEVMKEQLLQAKKEKEESKNRHEAEQQRIKNYENFLKEQKVQKRKATWCDFPETQAGNSKSENAVSKNKKKNKQAFTDQLESDQTVTTSICNGNSEGPPKKKKKKNKKNFSDSSEIQAEPSSCINNKTDINSEEVESSQCTKKSKKKKKDNTGIDIVKQHETKNNVDADKESHSKSQKKNINNAPLETASLSNEQNSPCPAGNRQNGDNFRNNNAKPMKKKRNKNLVDGKPQRRKDVNDKSFQIIINDAAVELERVDGFPVMKKDAERLNELKKNMIKKGIPKSEIQRTMKLERRRAEKALARIRKQVCYNCRKGGHNLSDCPDLKSKIPDAETGEGICFKCGSTEHRQFECKVQRDKEFRFATCFICKEPGHIARQCPDNPKGLYPNGGCCKLCGDVTHLRKDCPTVMDKKEDKSIKLSTLSSVDDVEGISQQTNKIGSDEPAKKVKKIKF